MRRAPVCGEHTDEILLDVLGLTEAQVGRLHDDRVVSGPSEPVSMAAPRFDYRSKPVSNISVAIVLLVIFARPKSYWPLSLRCTPFITDQLASLESQSGFR